MGAPALCLLATLLLLLPSFPAPRSLSSTPNLSLTYQSLPPCRPLLQAETSNGVRVCISLASDPHADADAWLATAGAEYPALLPLALTVRALLAQAGLCSEGGAGAGGLGAMPVALMALALLKEQVKAGLPADDPGHMLTGFLRYYGRLFDPGTHVVAPAHGGLLPRGELPAGVGGGRRGSAGGSGGAKAQRFSVVDPVSGLDLTGGPALQLAEVKQVLSDAASKLDMLLLQAEPPSGGFLPLLFDTKAAAEGRLQPAKAAAAAAPAPAGPRGSMQGVRGAPLAGDDGSGSGGGGGGYGPGGRGPPGGPAHGHAPPAGPGQRGPGPDRKRLAPEGWQPSPYGRPPPVRRDYEGGGSRAHPGQQERMHRMAPGRPGYQSHQQQAFQQQPQPVLQQAQLVQPQQTPVPMMSVARGGVQQAVSPMGTVVLLAPAPIGLQQQQAMSGMVQPQPIQQLHHMQAMQQPMQRQLYGEEPMQQQQQQQQYYEPSPNSIPLGRGRGPSR